MTHARFFVLVFGDPAQNGDTLESEQYAAGDDYPEFTVQPGDLVLLYCTEGYVGFKKQFHGIGIAIDTTPRLIKYRRIPFTQPIPLRTVDTAFNPEDQKKMKEIRFNTRRAFEIDRTSFSQTVVDQRFVWA